MLRRRLEAGLVGLSCEDRPATGGIIVTTLIGIEGAVVGGFVVGVLGSAGVMGFNVWSILVAILGAVILLAIYRVLVGSRST